MASQGGKSAAVRYEAAVYVVLMLFAAFDGGSRCGVLTGKSEVVLDLYFLYCSASIAASHFQGHLYAH